MNILNCIRKSSCDFDVYGKLVLQPDYLLVYPDKKSLKKRRPAVIPLRFLYYAIGNSRFRSAFAFACIQETG